MKTPLAAALFSLSLSALALAMASVSGCAGTATQESTGEYVDNTAITAKVKAEFIKDEIVRALDVQVDTFRGTVQLSGFVDTAEQKARAEQIAKTVPGVNSVTNNITVKGNSKSS
jgi:osmotically-inducible protein OsmY